MKTYAKRAGEAKVQRRVEGRRKTPAMETLQLSRLLHKAGAQARLKIGRPNDRYEQEADRVADRVMASPDSSQVAAPVVAGISPLRAQRAEEEEEAAQAQPLQRQIEEEEEEALQPKLQRQIEEEEEPVQPQRLLRQEEEEEAQAKLQRQEEEEEAAQAKGAAGGVASSQFSSQVSSLRGGGRPLAATERSFFEPRFGADFSSVRVHEGGQASTLARSVQAKAFTVGRDVVFGAGQYVPGSPQGRKLLAHELTHVVQQSGGQSGKLQPFREISRSAPSGTIQRRRLPKKSELAALLGGRNQTAHHAGLKRLLSRTMALLSPAQKKKVRKKARGSLSPAQFAKLPSTKQNILLAEALYNSYKVLRLGDPSQTEVGPRNSAERMKLLALFGLTAGHLTALSLGGHDTEIKKIFGAANLATVKRNYARALVRLTYLYRNNKIRTDRSGYSEEVGLGGYANRDVIMLSNDCFDKPRAHESIVTLVHESMHAGNANIGDYIYTSAKNAFPKKSAAIKLKNAAHYEIPLRRHLKMSHSFGKGAFIPAGTTVGGVTAAKLTPLEKGLDLAANRVRKAWDVGVSLHEFYISIHQRPQRWSRRYRRCFPYWSKVEKMTIHQRKAISRSSSDASRKPVTSIDLALSEGVSRKLTLASRAMLKGETKARAFLLKKMTVASYQKIRKNKYKLRDKLLRYVLQDKVGRMTGGILRDMAVLRALASAYDQSTYAKILRARSPSRFPYA
ncbi:protein of unknown function [Malonomonas rubra DSM 5091]|uniref:eCIS core domain-containing protein n=1 Tax=Malonomonas rubra DSM 5091 TaxID=1122189 RepID=A0A1M6LZS0_MALRU|nr:DUF4157 domain-containing protein [Malonomonas rubra]SHJ76664.1 protein of unknown function [Malonomonas rubra DSM 5091]